MATTVRGATGIKAGHEGTQRNERPCTGENDFETSTITGYKWLWFSNEVSSRLTPLNM